MNEILLRRTFYDFAPAFQMKRLKLQIIRRRFYSNENTEERIDSLLKNFEKSIREMKKCLQESGYSRRYFFTTSDISDKFEDDSKKFKDSILKRLNELSEWEFCKSILSLGSIFRWKEAEILFKEGKVKFSNSCDIYSAMIYSHGKVGNYLEALKLFEEANLKNLLNKNMLEALLEAYSVHVEKEILLANSLDEKNLETTRNSIYRQTHSERVLMEISVEPALKIYSQMIKLKFQPTISTLTRIIRLAGRLRRFSVIEDILRESERFSLKFDAQAYEVLIFAQMNCGRSEEAEESLKRALNNCSIEEFSRLLNVMLFGYCRLRRPLEANRLLKHFEGLGIKPSKSALSFLIGTAAKCGFIKDAEYYYKKLKEEEEIEESNLIIPASNHLLSAYLREDDFEKFFNLIDEIERDKYTNTMLFEALSRSKDMERLRKEIEKTKLLITKRTTNLSSIEISSLFKCLFSHFEGDDRLIKEFVKYVQIEIIEGTSSEGKRRELEIILLDVFSKLQEWERCVELVESLIKSSSKIVEPTPFSKLMTAAGPNPERIEFVFNWMGSVKCWRDPSILTTAMDFYWKAGYSNESRKLWEEIKSKRNKAKSFSIAISVMSEILLKEEGPISALNHLNNYKTLWNDLAVKIYLKSLRLTTGSSNEIENFFFEKAIKMNPPPSVEVCNEILISTLRSKEILNRIINWMCQSGCHPNVETMNILLSESSAEYLQVAAETLLDEMIKAGGKPSKESLLRIISSILENLKESDSTLKAENYTEILLKENSEIKLNLLIIWLKYFEKFGQSEKVEQIKLEIDKIK